MPPLSTQEALARALSAASAAPPAVPADEVVLVASGDLRLSANQTCWDAQREMEDAVAAALSAEGYRVRRAHEYDPVKKHGFIDSQRYGLDVFRRIDPNAKLVVAEAVWQYSHHVLGGLRDHKGPILTLANWSGQWPGLVGLLNLNASLTKMGKPYSTLWSKDFTDEFFRANLKKWLETGSIEHDLSHVHDFAITSVQTEERELGELLASELKKDKAVIGVFDEGCMGMYNAIFDDELINPMGLYKERLSQSALVAEMRRVGDEEAEAAFQWLVDRKFTFVFGTDEATELTKAQVLEQLKMYIAAVRIAADFGCAAIGIQYQQGLKDMTAASDLAEGLLNNVERPPVLAREGDGNELFAGAALPHFNEVDWGVGVDCVVTNRVWTAMGLDPATTLHDIRWGEHYTGNGIDAFVWVFEISGSVPASHNVGGYAGSRAERQPPMYFPRGGGTLKGVSKPGEIVWSRVFIMDDTLHADIGRATVVELPEEETERRLKSTTYPWPIMHAVLHGVSRDQLMARHRANHLNVAYGDDAASADAALMVKATMMEKMGIKVHLCGSLSRGV